jgi:hypothetical protein
MTLDLEVNEVEVKALTSLASVTWITAVYFSRPIKQLPISWWKQPGVQVGKSGTKFS